MHKKTQREQAMLGSCPRRGAFTSARTALPRFEFKCLFGQKDLFKSARARLRETLSGAAPGARCAGARGHMDMACSRTRSVFSCVCFRPSSAATSAIPAFYLPPFPPPQVAATRLSPPASSAPKGSREAQPAGMAGPALSASSSDRLQHVQSPGYGAGLVRKQRILQGDVPTAH